MSNFGELLDGLTDLADAPTGICRSCGRDVVGQDTDACSDCLERREQYSSRVRRWSSEAIRLHIPANRLDAIPRGEYRESKPLGHVRKWLDSGRPMLVLCGGVGTGKTFAAAVALWLCEGRGEVCKAGDLPMRWDPWGDERERYEPFRGRGLAVLDDLGEEDSNARWLDAFGRWIDARHASDDRTLITSNLRRADVRKRYGDRVADRLNDCAMAVEISGQSMRRKGAL